MTKTPEKINDIIFKQLLFFSLLLLACGGILGCIITLFVMGAY